MSVAIVLSVIKILGGVQAGLQYRKRKKDVAMYAALGKAITLLKKYAENAKSADVANPVSRMRDKKPDSGDGTSGD